MTNIVRVVLMILGLTVLSMVVGVFCFSTNEAIRQYRSKSSVEPRPTPVVEVVKHQDGTTCYIAPDASMWCRYSVNDYMERNGLK
jgi:hypothetical protein